MSDKYKDRPANEGKHGDGAQEPNSGVPEPEKEPAGRPKSESSRQQKHEKQATQTGSNDIDVGSARRAR